MVERSRLRRELGEEFGATEGLFEWEDDLATLSAFGQMLLGDLERTECCQILLAPKAHAVYDTLSGPRKRVVDDLLSRLRNPVWRNARYHAFSGSNLDVWKPRRSPVRFAGWVEGDTVRVALLFTDHCTYLRSLPGAMCTEFDRVSWCPWTGRSLTDPT